MFYTKLYCEFTAVAVAIRRATRHLSVPLVRGLIPVKRTASYPGTLRDSKVPVQWLQTRRLTSSKLVLVKGSSRTTGLSWVLRSVARVENHLSRFYSDYIIPIPYTRIQRIPQSPTYWLVSSSLIDLKVLAGETSRSVFDRPGRWYRPCVGEQKKDHSWQPSLMSLDFFNTGLYGILAADKMTKEPIHCG